MQNRLLGKSGLAITELGLGCWQLGGDFGPISEADSLAILDQAYQSGVRFYDTADVYGAGLSEQILGKFYQQHNDICIATKVGRDASLFPDKYTKQGLQQGIESSLQRLGGDSIGLIQLHCIPYPVMQDGEVFTWLQDFKQQGLIQHYGASVESMDEAKLCLNDPQLTSLQLIINIFRQDALSEVLNLAEKKNVGVIARLPYVSGLLSGAVTAQRTFADSDHRNYNQNGTAFHVGETFAGLPLEKALSLVEQLTALLPDNRPMAECAIRWLLDQPQITSVITGASKPQQIKQNVTYAQQAPLSNELHTRLANFYQQHVSPWVRGNR
ncbi:MULTISPECIES: aldo/keto reductase [unclassified Agarivorans]|uniref:aldo/keto reductase n=1 Tax=unclassified Agarivorans TaxID=2636026 RepID=UPI0026E249D0|nr:MULTISPECIES: aldo/keto reductase [unclassified Agarivorans]MDO6684674.1 aldo/keto reductase [Agarivorans sp. 3_MG-2023]MDO6714839.1 aldo/keto reductase [Agarivorans sp. 2_MG-2023]